MRTQIAVLSNFKALCRSGRALLRALLGTSNRALLWQQLWQITWLLAVKLAALALTIALALETPNLGRTSTTPQHALGAKGMP